MRTLAILDVETDSLDAQTGHLLEVAVVLFSVEHRAVITSRSWLVDHGLRENAAEAVNGIPPLLLIQGDSMARAESEVERYCLGVDAMMAHNADFDRQWLPVLAGHTWIDSMDLEWPKASASRGLVATALAHGVGVTQAHRAMADCFTLAALLERVAEMKDAIGRDPGLPGERPFGPFEQWLDRATRPKRVYEVADKSFDEKRNALAKAAGFRWDAAVKAWKRKMFIDDAQALPFAVREVQ